MDDMEPDANAMNDIAEAVSFLMQESGWSAADIRDEVENAISNAGG